MRGPKSEDGAEATEKKRNKLIPQGPRRFDDGRNYMVGEDFSLMNLFSGHTSRNTLPHNFIVTKTATLARKHYVTARKLPIDNTGSACEPGAGPLQSNQGAVTRGRETPVVSGASTIRENLWKSH